MSKEPQVLIDSEILRRYVLGNEQDRDVLEKVYGGILRELRQDLMNSMFLEEIKKLIEIRNNIKFNDRTVVRYHPLMYQNKGYMVKITVEEDELKLT